MKSKLGSLVALAIVTLTLAVCTRAEAQGASPAKVSAELNLTALHAGQDVVVAIVLDVKPGFHSQSHTPKTPNLIPLTIRADTLPGITFAPAVYPPGHDEEYPGLGVLNIYDGRTTFYVPAKIAADVKEGPLKLSGAIHYQICDDKSCFAPNTVPWSVGAKVVAKSEPTPANAPELFKDYKPATPEPATRSSTPPATRAATAPIQGGDNNHSSSLVPWVTFTPDLLERMRGDDAAARKPGRPPIDVDEGRTDWSVGTALGVAFLVGLIFNIMPCVLPVLPIKAMGFYEVAQHHRGKTILLALAFSAGIVAVFVLLGLLTLVLGVIGWSELISKGWFAWTIVGVLVVLAAGMFGGFAVNLPSGIYQWAPRHDTYFGNVQFGVLAALLSTPCTAPLLPAVMAWAATQPVALRILVMVVVGLGMAFPYVLLSAFPEAARKFPRVGPWSELVKQMMGFLLLGSAVFFAAGRLVPSTKFWWWLLPVAAAASLFLLVRTVQLSGRPRAVALASFLALLMTGATALTAAYMNGLLDRSHSTVAGGASELAGWDPLASSRPGGNVVLVKFTANWCLNCQTIDARVYHDVSAAAALKEHGVVPMKADLTEDDAVGWPTLKREEPSGGIPVTAIYVPGYELPIKLTQIYGVDKLKHILDEVGKLRASQVASSARASSR